MYPRLVYTLRVFETLESHEPASTSERTSTTPASEREREQTRIAWLADLIANEAVEPILRCVEVSKQLKAAREVADTRANPIAG